MAPTPTETPNPDGFEARYGREALFTRYASARVAQFWLRQVATVIGSVVVWFLVAPGAAAVCVLLVLAGEGLDLFTLTLARRLRARGMPFSVVWWLTTASAAVQGASLCACCLIVLTMAASDEVALIALCFLMAASVNAGFALTHHAAAARVRLAIFGFCAVSFLWFEALRHGFDTRLVIHMLEVLILGYMTLTFVAFYVRSWNRRIAKEGELIHAAATLNASNRDLEEAYRLADQAARAKSAFLATMSHEIRTPLNAVIGVSDLLEDHVTGPEGEEYLDTIREATQALLSVINDVLDLSRLDADLMTLEVSVFSPAATIESTVRMMRPLAFEKGLSLDLSLDADLPERVEGDEGRLRQILVNLLGNAVKFTEGGGIRVSAAMVPGAEPLLGIEVADTGQGVPPDRAEAIFDTFVQADAAITRRHGGSGLGLPIARSFARLMGGDVVLRPPQDAPGAVFFATLSLPPADAAPAAEPPPDPRALVGPMRVVLAEDNATNRLIVRRFLRDAPVDLIEAENGREAVEAVAWYRPQVVLMDMAMPELDGLEATRAIRHLDLKQPQIVALTANAFASDRVACADAGMDDFLAKPLRRAELIAALVRAERGEKTLFPSGADGVSTREQVEGDTSWTSPRESGTTSGRSIRSSGR